MLRGVGERQTGEVVKLRLHRDGAVTETGALPATAEGSCIAAIERGTRVQEEHEQETTI